MSKFSRLVFAFVLLMPMQLSASEFYNIQFRGNSFGGVPGASYSGGAVIGQDGDFWNQFVCTGFRCASQASNVPIYNSGAVLTGVTFSYSQVTLWNESSGSLFYNTPYRNLLQSYLYVRPQGVNDAPGTQDSAQYTFSGLSPNSIYDLVIYAVGADDGKDSRFSVNGVVKDIYSIGPAVLAEGNNYARFNALTDAFGGLLIGQIGYGSEQLMNGMQLAYVSTVEPVPEPSELLLLLSFAGAFWAITRNRQARSIS